MKWRVATLIICLAMGAIPSYGALASQQDGEMLRRIIGTDEEFMIPEWEPIPIETEFVDVEMEDVVGVPPESIILTEEQRQVQEEIRLGELEYVAQIIEAEGGNQPYEGKVAIGCVLYNRKKNNRFPNTIEGVIFQPGAFSCITDGRFNTAGWNVSEESYKAAQEAATTYENTEYLYFRTDHYHEFGTPIVKIGSHYFSKQ